MESSFAIFLSAKSCLTSIENEDVLIGMLLLIFTSFYMQSDKNILFEPNYF